MTTVPSIDIDQLRSIVRGPVLLPTDAGFDDARRPWNLAIEQDVRAVVEPEDAEDVACLIRFAAQRSIPIATQPSGHGATGRTADAILLRTGRLDALSIDPVSRTARIGAGVRSGDLQRAAAAHGLTALPGSSPVVTVTGAALGGGLSWFSRAFGWIADSILAFEVVTADGVARRLSPQNEPELFWALRGGGGDLAVVTSLELELHLAPTVFGGRQLWPATVAQQVADAFLRTTRTAPEALTLWLELLSFPGAGPMIAIDSTYLGDEATGRALLAATDGLPAPLSDSRALMSAADLGTITAEPTTPGPGCSRAELLTALDDAMLAPLLEEPISPLMTVQIRHLGGALARPSDSPHGPLTEPYSVYLFGVPATPGLGEAIARKQTELAQALPVSGRTPLSFLDPSKELSDALPETSLQRLRGLKALHDPAGIIRGNFSVLG